MHLDVNVTVAAKRLIDAMRGVEKYQVSPAQLVLQLLSQFRGYRAAILAAKLSLEARSCTSAQVAFCIQ
jgi:hypothetical protein